MQKKKQTKQKGNSVKPRISVQDRKMRRQQIGMAIVGGILIVAMVLALTIH